MPPSPKVKEAVEKFLNSGQLNWYPNINNEKLIHLLAKYSQVQRKMFSILLVQMTCTNI